MAAGLALSLLGGCGEELSSGGVADDPTVSSSSPPSPAETSPASGAASSSTSSPSSTDRTVAVYYVGDGPRGPALYRELRPVYEPDHGAAEAIGLLSTQPLDPDYRTAWPLGVFHGGEVNIDEGTIDLLLADDSLRDRQAPMSAAEARAAVQQVVYTLQEYAGQPLRVRFLLGDRPADRILGISLSEPVAAAPTLETLSLMSVTTPAEGQVVSGSFRASGFNNGFEGTAAWQVLDEGRVVAQGATIGGWMEDRLFAWHDHVDVSGLAPGTYTFLASNDDPTGGTEGFGPDTDTRTIVVQ